MADSMAAQMEEMEALEAIFGAEDFNIISKETPVEFEIILNPVSGGDEDDNHVQIKLRFRLPSTYPSTPPEVQYFPTKNIQNSQLQSIQSIVTHCISSSSNEVCIFNITEAVKDWLITHNKPQLSYHEQLEAERLEEEREEERRKQIEEEEIAKAIAKMPSPLGIEPGTIVTKESFLKWRALFEEEQRAIREEKQKEALARILAEGGAQRLTGKQLFQQNLAKELLDSEADELSEEAKPHAESAPMGGSAEATSVFWENEGLFADDDVDVDVEEELQLARKEERDKADKEEGEMKEGGRTEFKSYEDEDDDDEEYLPEDHFDFDDDDDDDFDLDDEEEDTKKSAAPKAKGGGKASTSASMSSSQGSGKGSNGGKNQKGSSAPKPAEKGKQGKGGNSQGTKGGNKGGKDGKGGKGKK